MVKLHSFIALGGYQYMTHTVVGVVGIKNVKMREDRTFNFQPLVDSKVTLTGTILLGFGVERSTLHPCQRAFFFAQYMSPDIFGGYDIA